MPFARQVNRNDNETYKHLSAAFLPMRQNSARKPLAPQEEKDNALQILLSPGGEKKRLDEVGCLVQPLLLPFVFITAAERNGSGWPLAFQF